MAQKIAQKKQIIFANLPDWNNPEIAGPDDVEIITAEGIRSNGSRITVLPGDSDEPIFIAF